MNLKDVFLTILLPMNITKNYNNMYGVKTRGTYQIIALFLVRNVDYLKITMSKVKLLS